MNTEKLNPETLEQSVDVPNSTIAQFTEWWTKNHPNEKMPEKDQLDKIVKKVKKRKWSALRKLWQEPES